MLKSKYACRFVIPTSVSRVPFYWGYKFSTENSVTAHSMLLFLKGEDEIWGPFINKLIKFVIEEWHKLKLTLKLKDPFSSKLLFENMVICMLWYQWQINYFEGFCIFLDLPIYLKLESCVKEWVGKKKWETRITIAELLYGFSFG